MFGQARVTPWRVPWNTCCRTLPCKTSQYKTIGQHKPQNTIAHRIAATTLCHPYRPFLQPAENYKSHSLLDWNQKNNGCKKDPKVYQHRVAVFGQARGRTRPGGRSAHLLYRRQSHTPRAWLWDKRVWRLDICCARSHSRALQEAPTHCRQHLRTEIKR